MRGQTPDTTPFCQSCGYSLAGLHLRNLLCPECGTRYYPPELPERLPTPAFLDPIARPHMVCSINALLCMASTVLDATSSRGRRISLLGSGPFPLDWSAGATVASVANLVLLIILGMWFPRHYDRFQLVLTTLLCTLSFIVCSGGCVRIH